MRFYKILFLLTIVTFSSCRKDEIFDPIESDPQLPPPENVDNNLINGTVNDDLFNPLSNVTIQLYDGNILLEETETSSEGEFYFIVDEIKDYLVYVVSPEYQDVLTTVNPSDSDNEVIVNLQLSGGFPNNWNISSYEWISLEGRVINSDGSPSINTTLLLIDFAGEFFNYTTTNSAGFYKSTIPADVYIYIIIDQACATDFNEDIVISDDDVIIGDLILENGNGSVTLSGNVIDCHSNPIQSGEIIFYGESDYFVGVSQNNVVKTAEIIDGFFEIEFDRGCSSQVYYEAIDYRNNSSVYGEVYDLDSNTILEDIEICDFFFEGGTVDVDINNLSFNLNDHFAFEYNNYLSVFSFDGSDYVEFEFESNMAEGTYGIDHLLMVIQGEVYHSSGIELEVVVSVYPQNNQENIVGHIEGEIHHAGTQQKRSFALDFDIPVL